MRLRNGERRLARGISGGGFPQRDALAQVPQRGRYAKFRYLPHSLDVRVSQQREQLRRQLRAQKLEERFTTWLTELRARAFIEIREP